MAFDVRRTDGNVDLLGDCAEWTIGRDGDSRSCDAAFFGHGNSRDWSWSSLSLFRDVTGFWLGWSYVWCLRSDRSWDIWLVLALVIWNWWSVRCRAVGCSHLWPLNVETLRELRLDTRVLNVRGGVCKVLGGTWAGDNIDVHARGIELHCAARLVRWLLGFAVGLHGAVVPNPIDGILFARLEAIWKGDIVLTHEHVVDSVLGDAIELLLAEVGRNWLVALTIIVLANSEKSSASIATLAVDGPLLPNGLQLVVRLWISSAVDVNYSSGLWLGLGVEADVAVLVVKECHVVTWAGLESCEDLVLADLWKTAHGYGIIEDLDFLLHGLVRPTFSSLKPATSITSVASESTSRVNDLHLLNPSVTKHSWSQDEKRVDEGE